MTEDEDDVDDSGFLVIFGLCVVDVVVVDGILVVVVVVLTVVFLVTNGLIVVGLGDGDGGGTVVVSTDWNVENFGGSTVEGFVVLSLFVVSKEGFVVLLFTVVLLFMVVNSIASSLCSIGESLREMFLIAFSSVVNLYKALVGCCVVDSCEKCEIVF